MRASLEAQIATANAQIAATNEKLAATEKQLVSLQMWREEHVQERAAMIKILYVGNDEHWALREELTS